MLLPDIYLFFYFSRVDFASLLECCQIRSRLPGSQKKKEEKKIQRKALGSCKYWHCIERWVHSAALPTSPRGSPQTPAPRSAWPELWPGRTLPAREPGPVPAPPPLPRLPWAEAPGRASRATSRQPREALATAPGAGAAGESERPPAWPVSVAPAPAGRVRVRTDCGSSPGVGGRGGVC